MKESVIYDYCRERLEEIDIKIGEMLIKGGVITSKIQQEEMALITAYFLLALTNKNHFIKSNPSIYKAYRSSEKTQRIAALICATNTLSLKRIAEKSISVIDALKLVEKTWFVFGMTHSALIIKNSPDSLSKIHAEARSIMGRSGADARHAETRMLREEVKKYWRENIDSKLSNSKSADILLKISPLSHRTLTEIVAEAKKEAKNKV